MMSKGAAKIIGDWVVKLEIQIPNMFSVLFFIFLFNVLVS
jgi:hypothetical protein